MLFEFFRVQTFEVRSSKNPDFVLDSGDIMKLFETQRDHWWKEKLPWKKASSGTAAVLPYQSSLPSLAGLTEEWKADWESVLLHGQEALEKLEFESSVAVLPQGTWMMKRSRKYPFLMSFEHPDASSLTLSTPDDSPALLAWVSPDGRRVLTGWTREVRAFTVHSREGLGLLLEQAEEELRVTPLYSELLELPQPRSHSPEELKPLRELLAKQKEDWLKEEVEESLESEDLWEQVVGAGDLFRYQHWSKESRQDWLNDLLEGRESLSEAPLTLAQNWDTGQLLILRSLGLAMMMQLEEELESLEAAGPDEHPFLASLLFEERDRLESALRLLEESPELKQDQGFWAELKHLDSFGESLQSVLSQNSSPRELPRFERALEVSPEAWWIRPFDDSAASTPALTQEALFAEATQALSTPQWRFELEPVDAEVEKNTGSGVERDAEVVFLDAFRKLRFRPAEELRMAAGTDSEQRLLDFVFDDEEGKLSVQFTLAEELSEGEEIHLLVQKQGGPVMSGLLTLVGQVADVSFGQATFKAESLQSALLSSGESPVVELEMGGALHRLSLKESVAS
jgi:hypothetical protein